MQPTMEPSLYWDTQPVLHKTAFIAAFALRGADRANGFERLVALLREGVDVGSKNADGESASHQLIDIQRNRCYDTGVCDSDGSDFLQTDITRVVLILQGVEDAMGSDAVLLHRETIAHVLHRWAPEMEPQHPGFLHAMCASSAGVDLEPIQQQIQAEIRRGFAAEADTRERMFDVNEAPHMGCNTHCDREGRRMLSPNKHRALCDREVARLHRLARTWRPRVYTNGSFHD